ncbi:hypothetical protein P3T51_11865 (plasmid) [Weissella confusa]|jgi:hypothetical protein|uniref:hypothetical protein n=1 Tax=Weissella confusa TaxID=1583 RepID=UPI0021C190F1|nr:hypothetical protein [Weissella confusa]MCT8397865.1 hypothetical protein [Weissella confusa]WEY49373.1 hypothetical protein P3T51_11920 [Weissella confusa]WEY49385.1 hypothetical protein P3T51_11865 [Weissella confusa]
MSNGVRLQVRGVRELTVRIIDEKAKEFNLSRSAFINMLLDDYANDALAAKGIELSANRLDNMVSVMNTLTKTFNDNNSEIVKALNSFSTIMNAQRVQLQELELTLSAKMDVLIDDDQLNAKR